MGGKTKQSQRTKNNVRPSSSGRSALLLNNANLETGVMNTAGADLPASFPTLTAPNIDPLVSPELQLCIKKLNKKDPITKTKALQELSELVVNSKQDDVVAVLPSWAHFYRLLTSDPNRKVREVTQLCHGSIVSVCGRRLAPQLKTLMPAWLQAQYDEHAPAQTHAQASLAKTFPDSKLPEVILFCKNEIVSHLMDNLTGTGESALIKKTDTPEEKEIQLIRILASSLHGMQFTVQYLPREQDGWLWERVDAMLRASVFWKRATHTDNRIRVAWYAVVGRVIERYKGQFAELYGQKTLRMLIGAKESTPLAAAQLWDALLLFMHNVEEWTKYLDKSELLSKRILDVLESGGWGDARHLSNILLPFLAHLPPEMVTKQFFIVFFNALFNGLDKKSILSSKSERQAWITSLDECLRYISIQQYDFILEIVTSVHRTWLERILSNTHDGLTRTNLIKYSANAMASLVKYWLKQAQEGHSEKYDQLIRNFWQNVGSTIAVQADKLSTDHAEVTKQIEGHILLLQTLKTSFIHETKKQQSIKFDGDSPTVVEKAKESPQCDASIVERYNHNLNDLVQTICGHYFEFASKKQISSPVLMPLITLLIDFDSPNLFTGIARQFDCESTYKFYEKVLRCWLAGDTMRCKAIVDIIFLFMKHLTEPEKDALFGSFKQFPPSVVEWCISLSLSHPHCLSPAVQRWLRSPLVETTLCSICIRMIDTGDSKAKNLLLLCLNHDSKGEMIISQGAVSKILGQLSLGVTRVASPALEQVAGVSARLCTTLVAPGLQRLVLALFELSVRVPRGSSRLSLETWCEVLAAWQDGLAALQENERRNALYNAARILHQHSQLDDKSTDFKQIEHVISLCPYLLSTNCGQDISEIVEFTRTIFDVIPPDLTLIKSYALRYKIVKGEINCPFQDDNVTPFITNDYIQESVPEMTKENMITFISNCVFRAMYLKTILLHKVDEELDDNWCNDLFRHDYFVQEFCKVLNDFMVVCSLFEGYTFWPHYNLIKQTKHKLDNLVCDVISECTSKTKKVLQKALSVSAATEGYYWSFTARWFQKSQNVKCDKNLLYSLSVIEEAQRNCERRRENRESGNASPTEEESDMYDSEAVKVFAMKLQSVITASGYYHNAQAHDHWPCITNSYYHTQYMVMLRSFYVAHCINTDKSKQKMKEKFINDVIDNLSQDNGGDLDVIVDTYYQHNEVMLYEKDITNYPWSHVVSNAAIADYLATQVSTKGWDLPAHHWDFNTITLCHLLTSVVDSKKEWGSTKVAVLTRAVLNLFLKIEKFVSGVKEECMKKQPSDHVAHLPHEWGDIFAPDATNSLFTLIVYILESSTKTDVTSNHIAVLDVLIQCTRRLKWEDVPSMRRSSADFAIQRVASSAAAALRDPVHYCYKYLAYELLLVMLEPMVFGDALLLASWSEYEEEHEGAEERGVPVLSLAYYDDAFLKLKDLVETAVAHINVCEGTCELVEFTDVHILALGWFLLVEVMGQHCRLSKGDLQHHYIQIFRDKKYTVPLLKTALRLLPADVFAQAQEDDAAPEQRNIDMFTSLAPLNAYEYCSAQTVSAAACRAIYWSVCGAGVGDARGWRGAAPHRHARLLDNIVQSYVTPQLVKDEFTTVHRRASEIEDTEVIILWSSYEMIVNLTLEDRPIELRVALSRSHPLGLPHLVVPENSPAGNTNWLIMYLGYQNGSLLNALKMWSAAVTRKVERSPQCYICYCRLHFATGRLPTSYCRTCRNKFHTPCLRKWFITSNKSNCPLCRANF